jgi:hypothetical protein
MIIYSKPSLFEQILYNIAIVSSLYYLYFIDKQKFRYLFHIMKDNSTKLKFIIFKLHRLLQIKTLHNKPKYNITLFNLHKYIISIHNYHQSLELKKKSNQLAKWLHEFNLKKNNK